MPNYHGYPRLLDLAYPFGQVLDHNTKNIGGVLGLGGPNCFGLPLRHDSLNTYILAIPTRLLRPFECTIPLATVKGLRRLK